MRIGKELPDLQRIADDISKQEKAISENFNKSKNVNHEQKYTNKKMHGYFHKKLTGNDETDQKLSYSRTKYCFMTSHFQGFLAAI